MINWLARTLSTAAIFCAFIFTSTAYSNPTLKDYGALPEVQLITISPSGNLVAFRKITDDSDLIIILSLATNEALVSINVATIKPNSIHFLNEDQLVLVASKTTLMPGYSKKIDVSTAFLCDVKTGDIRQLLIPGDVIYPAQTGLGKIIGLSPDGDYAYMPAFVGEEGTHKPEYSLVKVNLKRKGSPNIYSKGTNTTKDFFLDAEGTVLAQESYDEHNNIHKVRARHNDEWVDIFKENTEILDKEFVGLTPDYKSLVMLETNTATGYNAYYTLSLADGSVSGPLFGRDDADIDSVVSNSQRVVFGVRYSGLRPSYQFFDEKLNQRMKTIVANFPDQSVYLRDFSPDWKNLVIYADGSAIPSEYYLFSESKVPRFLASARSNIKTEDLHPIGTVTFLARDGFKIPTLLTIPKNKVGDMKNLPAVIMPHGGPAVHDTIGFNWEAQALAENGYLVIQPQFRGSNGFGLAYEQAGHGEWGKKMQDDITDTVNFAVRKGLIDPKRICIVGASYGGYAALAGGAFTPDLYQCVVSTSGISDLKSMLSWDKGAHGKDSWVVTYMEQQFTKGEDDTEAMAAVSPEKFAANFKAPVLLIHGTEDKRVPISQSERMNKELKRANKDVRFIELKGEDHFLSKGPTRLTALEEMVKFVNVHIGQKKEN